MRNPKFKTQNSNKGIELRTQSSEFRCWCLFVIWCLVLGALPGCASLGETAKGFAGISTRTLEENRKTALTAVCSMDYNSCFSRTVEALKSNGAYIYNQDVKNHRIAFYVSEQDTTPVGVFFKENEANITGVEVASPSDFAKELFAQKIFDAYTGTKK